MNRIRAKCKCGKEFTTETLNGMKRTSKCPNCQYRGLLKDKPVKGLKSKRKTKGRAKAVPWKEKNLISMIKHVQDRFCNPYIRARDKNLFGKCISCNGGVTQAGHRYPTSTHGGMRFNVNNIHGQEVGCNMFKSGNLDAYDKGLMVRHGIAYLNKLKHDESVYARTKSKFHRHDIIEIGETFKYLLENKIWVFDQSEFNKLRSFWAKKNLIRERYNEKSNRSITK